MLTCPCRLDGSIEGQQVRLLGDSLNDADGFTDMLRALIELRHGLRRLIHRKADLLHRVYRTIDTSYARLGGLSRLCRTLTDRIRCLRNTCNMIRHLTDMVDSRDHRFALLVR